MKEELFAMDCGCVHKTIVDENGKRLFLFDMNEEPDFPDCQKTWELLGDGRTVAVFQLESNLGQTWSRKLKPKNLEHMSALGAVLRPGCLQSVTEDGVSMTSHYCKRVNKEEDADPLHSSLSEMLSDTENVMIYQEQMMKIGAKLAGFNKKEVDQLRKCVTKNTTFVSKTRGIISIEELMKTGYKDDLFLVIDDLGNKHWKKIKEIWSTGKKAVHDVETSSGNYVSATQYHQFLCVDGWKAKCRLKPKKDWLISCRQIDFDGEDVLDLSHCLVITGILTEGYFPEDNTRGHFTNYDNFMMNTYINHYKNIFGQYPTMVNNFKVALINAESKKYLEQFMSSGLSHKKEFPQVMLGATKSTMASFLSFALGAEGGVSESGQFEYSSKSKKMIYQIKMMLLRYGIRSNLCEKKVRGRKDKYYRLYINCANDQQKLYDQLSYYWPQYKRDGLKKIIDKKKHNQFTSDVFPKELVKKLLNQYPWVGQNESGTIYTSDISRHRFSRIANKTEDKYWEKIANGYHCYEKFEGLKNRKSSIEVFDFTIDEDTPYIVANGMIIHNCVGKKNQKDLNEIGKVFIEKAEKIGIVTKEQAETIFENIKASGRYLFNKCLCPNTIVHIYNDKSPDITGKQAVILDDVKIGDLIYTKHGFSRVLDKIESGKKRLYKIITESGYTLKCTLDHKIDCYDGIQRPLHEIIENNHLIFADFGIGERIISCQSVGLERTIDIEVKNPSHTFYANGISVSNSHSYSYGSTGYDTAYLKSHFPVQYFTSCLSMAKDAEEKSILIQDSKSFGITVNPPCIRNSRGNFYTDGEQIWFGINNIKKIGRKNSSKLKNILLENNKDYKTINWVEWLLTCGQECNSTMKILVMAGAFDCMNIKRQLMLEHLKIVKELSDGEIKWVKNNIKDNFLDCLKNMAKTKKEGGGCHNNKRVEIVKSMISLVENCPYSLEDNVAWIVWAEEQTLGLPVSKNKVESYDLSDINCYAKEYNDGMCGRLTIGVELVQVKEITTKKGKNVGSKMAFIVGSDKTGIIENIVCFPDKWKDFSEFLVEGNTVLISGERKSKDDGFVVGMVSQLV